MPDWDDIGNRFWKALMELDVGPILAEAEKGFRLALIGAPGSGKTNLACDLAARTPGEPYSSAWAELLPEYRLPLSVEDVTQLNSATLLILLLDATKGDYVAEVAAAEYLSYFGKPMLVCYNKMDLLPVETKLIRGQARWRGAEIMPLSAVHPETVQELLVPAVLEVLPGHALSLGRRLPLFRSHVAGKWIEQAALVNATYASASGLAEAVPMLRVPLHSDDIAVLSSNQASLAYRIALTYGLAANWHQEAAAAGLADETGRLCQQFTRQLSGPLPLWSLESKVGLAYGSTIALGRAIQYWCDTGHSLSPRDARDVCHQAVVEARRVSHALVARARDALPTARAKPARSEGLKFRLPGLPKRRPKPKCPNCGRINPMDAAFCAYCGVRIQDTGSKMQEASAGMPRDVGSKTTEGTGAGEGIKGV